MNTSKLWMVTHAVYMVQYVGHVVLLLQTHEVD